MSVNITTEPIDVTIGGVTFNLQSDPSASKHWDNLMQLEVIYSDPKKRDESLKQLIDICVGMAETDEDAETIKGLDTTKVGPATLQRVLMEYAREVTGFPTQPAKSSTKGSKRTGGN